MIHPDLRARLEAITPGTNLILATDYDGVLSPIVADPSTAVPDPDALAAFLEAGREPTITPVVVSGRGREALISFIGEPDGVVLIGNHGADLGGEVPPSPESEGIRSALEEAAQRYPGTLVEPKPHGAALHYRNAEDRLGARNAAIRAAADLPGRAIEGKEVLEIVVGTATKGTAIEELQGVTGATTVVYLGDDITDEDVFTSLGPRDIGIKVGPGETAAPHRIDTISDVAEVFATVGSSARSGNGDG